MYSRFTASATFYHYKKTKRNEQVVKSIKENIPKFKPNILLPGPYTKLLTTYRPGPSSKIYRREYISYSDGGIAGLDFYPKKKISTLSGKSLIVFYGGFMGSSQDRYLFDPIKQFNDKTGHQVVMVNWRGSAGAPITGNYPLKWSRVEDVDEVLEYINTKYQPKNIFLAGFSVGANLIQLYLGVKGERKQKPLVKAAVAVASPNCLKRSQIKVDRNVLLRIGLVNSLRGLIDEHLQVETFMEKLQMLRINPTHLKSNFGTIIDVDEKALARLNGFDDVDNYYYNCSGLTRIDQVEVPLLNIYSDLDPIVKYNISPYYSASSQPIKECLTNDNLFVLRVTDGGHVSFPHGCNNMNVNLYILNYSGQLWQVVSFQRVLFNSNIF